MSNDKRQKPGRTRSGLDLDEALETDDPKTAAELLAHVGRDIHDLRRVFFLLYRLTDDLPFEAIRRMGLRCLAGMRDHGYEAVEVGPLLGVLFVKHPADARNVVLNLAEETDDAQDLIACMEWAEEGVFMGKHEARAQVKDTLAILKGLDPIEERAKEAFEEARKRYELEIYRALDAGDIPKARALVFDADTPSMLSAKTVNGVLQDYTIEAAIKGEDTDRAWRLVEFYLDLLDYKEQHPDPAVDASIEDLLIQKRGSLAANVFWLASLEAPVDEQTRARGIALARELLDGGRFVAPMAYRLAAYYARSGD